MRLWVSVDICVHVQSGEEARKTRGYESQGSGKRVERTEVNMREDRSD